MASSRSIKSERGSVPALSSFSTSPTRASLSRSTSGVGVAITSTRWGDSGLSRIANTISEGFARKTPE